MINDLERLYPGTKVKFCEGDRIRPGIAVYADGILIRRSLGELVDENAEIHFLPAIGGGIDVNSA